MSDEERFVIDIDDLELGEIEQFEETVGHPLGDLDLNNLPAKALIGLIWITKKRDDPKFTLDKARKVKLSQLGGGENGNGDAPPTQAKPKSKRGGAGTR